MDRNRTKLMFMLTFVLIALVGSLSMFAGKAGASPAFTPETSSHFEEWVNPSNGIKSYLLQTDNVSFNQAFYYTQSMMTDDGSYMWFTAAKNPDNSNMVNDSFDDVTETVYQPPLHWTIAAASLTEAAIAPNPLPKVPTDVHTLELSDNNPAGRVTAEQSFTAQESWILASWEFMESGTSGNWPRFTLQSGNDVAVDITVNGSSQLIYRDSLQNAHIIQSIASDTWYSIKVIADPELDTFDIWVNHELVLAGCEFSSSVGSINKIVFATGNTPTGTLHINETMVTADKTLLGLIDFTDDSLHLFEDALFEESSPLVDQATGDIYYMEAKQFADGQGYRLYRQSPDPNTARVLVNTLPKYVAGADPRQVVTHLSFNASKDAVHFDSGNYDNNKTYIGLIPLDGSPAELWTTFDRRLDHALLSPTDDDLMLISEDNYTDKITGAQIDIDDRSWLADSSGNKTAIFPDSFRVYHEWWDPSGDYIWYLDQKGVTTDDGSIGTAKVNIHTGEVTMVWAGAVGHSHADDSGRYLVGDHDYKTWPDTDTARISFFDVLTNREIDIVTSMPYPQYDQYHVHPHPHFENDDYIIYTSTVDNSKVQVAVTPIQQLKDAAYYLERTYEAESTSYTTNNYVYTYPDANASGGEFIKLNANGTGKYIEYTINIPEAGTYDVSFRVQTGGDAGQYVFKADGTQLGAQVDLYDSSSEWTVYEMGEKYYGTGGEKTFRMEAAGKHASSSGYILRLDYIQLNKIKIYEAETATYSTNHYVYTYTDLAASGGEFIKLNANGSGKYIEYTIDIPEAGTYDISFRAQKGGDTGQYTLIVDGTPLGSQVDFYGSNWTIYEMGKRYFNTSGEKTIRLEATGKNVGSSDYVMRLDHIQLVKVNTQKDIYEAESTTYATNSYVYTYPSESESGGAFIKLNASGTGKYIDYTINLPEAGTYDIAFRMLTGGDSGQYVFIVDSSQLGGPTDFNLIGTGNIRTMGEQYFSTGGNKTFRFEAVGKNSNSTGYAMRLDYIQLINHNQ